MTLIKCTCEECGGEGRVPCAECGGSGQRNHTIDSLPVSEGHPKFAELSALKDDAERVRKQCGQLEAMNPARTTSYREQLSVALAEISRQAEKALKAS